jgi:uncharacterized protein YkvS
MIIETKISGKEVVAAEADNTGKVIDLMEGLKVSVEKAQKRKGISVIVCLVSSVSTTKKETLQERWNRKAKQKILKSC